MTADPKPRRRVKASPGQWQKIVRQKEGPCRGCGAYPWVTFHHLVGRDLGGDDVAENIIPLCGHGTHGCHGTLENHPAGWEAVAANVRRSLTAAEVGYVLGRKGEDWLNRYYPEGGRDGDTSGPA